MSQPLYDHGVPAGPWNSVSANTVKGGHLRFADATARDAFVTTQIAAWGGSFAACVANVRSILVVGQTCELLSDGKTYRLGSGGSWSDITSALSADLITEQTTRANADTALGVRIDDAEAAISAKADKSITVSGGGLATGGGSLADNRTITVPKASQSDVATGTDDTKALTPLSVAAEFAAVRSAIEAAVVGLLDYRGSFIPAATSGASGFPATGGSGAAGAIKKGDTYYAASDGFVLTEAIQSGDVVIARTDSPGQTATNWDRINKNISFTPEDAANRVTSWSGSPSDSKYPSEKLVKDTTDALDTRLDTVEAALPGKASTAALSAEESRAQAAEATLSLTIVTESDRRFYSDAAKFAGDTFANGEALGGAQFFDGTTTVGADATDGGLKIPAGQTGLNAYTRQNFAFNSDEKSRYAGRVVRLLAEFVTTANILAALPDYSVTVDSVSGGLAPAVSNAKAWQPRGYSLVVQADLDMDNAGAPSFVGLAFQNLTATAQPADVTLHCVRTWFAALDARGAVEVIEVESAAREVVANESLTRDIALSASIVTESDRQFIISALKYQGLTYTNGEALGGAQFWNGSTTVGADATDGGVRIPAGQTGQWSYIRDLFQFSAAEQGRYGRRVVRIATIYETSANLLANLPDFSVSVDSVVGPAPLAVTNKKAWMIDSYRMVVQADVTMDAPAPSLIGLAFQTVTATVQGSAVSWHKTASWFGALDADGAIEPLIYLPAATQESMRALIPEKPQAIKVVRIALDGSGNYTSINAAIAAEGGGLSELFPVEYLVSEGTYYEYDIGQDVPGWIRIIGNGDRKRVRIFGDLGADHDPADIQNHQTFWPWASMTVIGVTVEGKNIRYPYHFDTGVDYDFRSTVRFIDCDFIHYGNQEAIDYQTGLGGSGNPGAVWTGVSAIGIGTAQGVDLTISNGRAQSPTVALRGHDNKDFNEPSYVDVSDMTLIGGQYAVFWDGGLGSGVTSRLTMRGVTHNGAFLFNGGAQNLSTNPKNWHANPFSAWSVHVHASDPFYVNAPCPIDVLQLLGAAAGQSTLTVSGTAATPLLGLWPEYRAGTWNYPARLFGQFMAKTPAGSDRLGGLLGNCASVNKSLTVVVNGTSHTITLAANYTAMTNAQVVTALNDLLTAAGSAARFSIQQPYAQSHPVIQHGWEKELCNVGVIAALPGTPLIADSDPAVTMLGMQGSPPTGTATADQFVGICLEVILPAEYGRVAGKGYKILRSNLVITGSPTFVIGDTLQIGSTGDLEKGTTNPVLRCCDIHPTDGAVFQII